MRRTPDSGIRTPVFRGFSLVESLVAITVTAVAGGALLTALSASVQSSMEATQTIVARGLARQLMEEIAARRFPNGSPNNGTGTSSNREGFDDYDDYDGWHARPPQDRRGETLGTDGSSPWFGASLPRPDALQPDPAFLARFTREATVEPVAPDDAGGWAAQTGSTDFRRVTVRVLFTDGEGDARPLAEIIRVFSRVPPAP